MVYRRSQMREYLKSGDPSFDSDDIIEAFHALHPVSDTAVVSAFFEHGQWWVRVSDIEAIDDDDVEHTYSVCDASGPPSLVYSGFSFEEV
jgi:hypothetical protein